MQRPLPHYLPQVRGGTLQWPRVTRKVYNRSGSTSTVNALYQYDIGLTQAAETTANSQGITLPAVTNHTWDSLSGCWMNVITPNGTGSGAGGTSGYLRYGFWVVALEAVANNELMTVMECGEVTLPYAATSTNTALTGVTYTHVGTTLTKTGGFANYTWRSGDQININSGTNAITGLHTITSKTNNDTIVLGDAGGTGDQTNFNVTVSMRLDPWTRLEPADASTSLVWVFANSGPRRIAMANGTVRSLASTSGTVATFFSGWGTGLN